ncbi:hypothetical protein FSP39_003151 [Pinctada imbricata]|uniref:Uncharacterized protein n=1 Tax=Pinctada imbricata TaxID=66713 RepID=A0AA89C4R9_PINIB|nr:hypothetical protein FSP39_003151 [Pinctada imbricata]
MPEGHIQPQLKRRGRPLAKEKESEEELVQTTVVENTVQSSTIKNEMVSDQRANAALTLSSLAAGTLDSLPISKSTEQTVAETSAFLQKPAENMHCDIPQSIPISNEFIGIANYTVVQSTPIQPSVPRALENQQLLFSNLPTPSIGHLQTMDKETLLPQTSDTFHEVEETSAVVTLTVTFNKIPPLAMMLACYKIEDHRKNGCLPKTYHLVGSAIPRRVPDRLKVRVIPKRDDPPSPVPSDSELLPEKGQVVHDLFTNLATDIARNIVHELRIPEKLRYASRFCSKGNKNKNSEDVDFF